MRIHTVAAVLLLTIVWREATAVYTNNSTKGEWIYVQIVGFGTVLRAYVFQTSDGRWFIQIPKDKDENPDITWVDVVAVVKAGIPLHMTESFIQVWFTSAGTKKPKEVGIVNGAKGIHDAKHDDKEYLLIEFGWIQDSSGLLEAESYIFQVVGYPDNKFFGEFEHNSGKCTISMVDTKGTRFESSHFENKPIYAAGPGLVSETVQIPPVLWTKVRNTTYVRVANYRFEFKSRGMEYNPDEYVAHTYEENDNIISKIVLGTLITSGAESERSIRFHGNRAEMQEAYNSIVRHTVLSLHSPLLLLTLPHSYKTGSNPHSRNTLGPYKLGDLVPVQESSGGEDMVTFDVGIGFVDAGSIELSTHIITFTKLGLERGVLKINKGYRKESTSVLQVRAPISADEKTLSAFSELQEKLVEDPGKIQITGPLKGAKDGSDKFLPPTMILEDPQVGKLMKADDGTSRQFFDITFRQLTDIISNTQVGAQHTVAEMQAKADQANIRKFEALRSRSSSFGFFSSMFKKEANSPKSAPSETTHLINHSHLRRSSITSSVDAWLSDLSNKPKYSE